MGDPSLPQQHFPTALYPAPNVSSAETYAELRGIVAAAIVDVCAEVFAPFHLNWHEEGLLEQVREWTFRKNRRTREEWAEGSNAMRNLQTALSRKFASPPASPMRPLLFPLFWGALLLVAYLGYLSASFLLGIIGWILFSMWNEEVQNRRARDWALKSSLDPLCDFVGRRNGEGLSAEEKNKLQALCKSFMRQHDLNKRRRYQSAINEQAASF